MQLFKFTLPSSRGTRAHHAKRYVVSEEEIGGSIDRLEVFKHRLKGDMLVVYVLLNGATKVKFILLNVVPEDKLEAVIHISGWRIFVEKPHDGGCCVFASHIDDEEHQDVVNNLTKRQYLLVKSKMLSAWDEDDVGYSSDPDLDILPGHCLFH